MPWPDEAACAASARRLAAALAAVAFAEPSSGHVFIELHGPLGAGKTTFARHLLHALGVVGTVRSPTYTLMEPYAAAGGLAVSHFDFYRFDDAQEWEDAGFRDVFAAPGLKLVEWPEKAEGLLPRPDLLIAIDPQPRDGEDDGFGPRLARFDAVSPLGLALLP